MATLNDIFIAGGADFENFIDKYKIETFVETGTGVGDSIKYVSECKKLTRIYSIEIIERLAITASERMAYDKRVEVINDSSISALKYLCKKIGTNNRPTLFFLDAHFPGADFGFERYDKEFDKAIKTPLEEELDIIRKYKDIRNDVFIIDDLRIYEDGDYALGNWSKEKGALLTGLDFLNKFNETHMLVKHMAYSGFAIMLPRDKEIE